MSEVLVFGVKIVAMLWGVCYLITCGNIRLAQRISPGCLNLKDDELGCPRMCYCEACINHRREHHD
jgi:hypothetical protein